MKPSARFVTIVPMIVLAVIIVAAAQPPWTALRLAGLPIAILGFTLLTLARVQLGNAFSITPQATTLVTGGIYSRVRHPVYVFSAVGLAGLFLYLDVPQLLAVLLIVVPLQVLRARREERVLEEHFGEQYRAYRRSTWF